MYFKQLKPPTRGSAGPQEKEAPSRPVHPGGVGAVESCPPTAGVDQMIPKRPDNLGPSTALPVAGGSFWWAGTPAT